MKPVRTAATLLAGLALTATRVLTACSQSTEGSDSSDVGEQSAPQVTVRVQSLL